MFVVHPPATKRAVLRMCRRGATDAEVARTFNVSSSSVRIWRRAAGIPPRSQGVRKFSDAQRRLAMRLFRRSETSLDEIAATVGACTKTITWWAKTLGVTRSKPIDRHRHSATTRRIAVELYAKGKSARYAAEVVGDGIDWHTVIGWARAAGVPIRSGAVRG